MKQGYWFFVFETVIGKFFIAGRNQLMVKSFFPVGEEFIRSLTDDYFFEENPLINNYALQIKQYLSGQLKRFDIPVSPDGTAFQKKVWRALEGIPYGEIRTYQEIAAEIRCNGFRAVGNACRNNPLPLIIPCHRVIGKKGQMTGYGGNSDSGRELKLKLLELEGYIPDRSSGFLKTLR